MRGIVLHDHVDVGPVECARDAVEVQVVGALRVQLTEWQTRAPRQVAFADVRLHAAVRVVKLAAQLTNQYQPLLIQNNNKKGTLTDFHKLFFIY